MPSIRQDMVKRAVVFLRHPKVKDAPREKQVAFLKDKSLTAEEIDEALRKATEIAAAAERKSRIPIPLSIKRLQQGTERSEAVIAGSMVFVSAQTASLPGEAEGGASGNAEEQTASALGKVQILLEEAGSSQTKIVTAVLYVRDFEDMSAVHAAWRRWTGDDNMPATTVVQAGVEKEDSGLRVAVQVTAHL